MQIFISFADLPLPEHIGKIDLFTNYQFILRNDHPALAKATTEEILKRTNNVPLRPFKYRIFRAKQINQLARYYVF